MAEGYVRTKVRAKNPSKGVYRTLDGSHEIRQADKKGHWDVYRLVGGGAQRIAAEVKGYDRALDRILEEPGVTLEQLNTAPKVEAKPTKQELAERFAAEDASRAEPDPATERKPRQRKAAATA
jgi:hypothetical protein